MYVITNREIDDGQKGLKKFGDKPNEKGINELRLAHVSDDLKDVQIFEDELDSEEIKTLREKFNLDISLRDKWYVSLKVACELFEQAVKEKKNILFFVHGYNNDIADVLKTAKIIEKTYNVIVMPFSWPANGGGIHGKISYKSDKADARVSATALHRFVGFIHDFHQLLTAGRCKDIEKQCHAKFPDNAEAAQKLYMKLMEKQCNIKLNLACHSMGNYLLKYALKPEQSTLRQLVFDNVSLIAADANNKDHVTWVDEISVRNRVFIVINENDYALAWSRRKPGDEQRARLGHYLKKLYSESAYYLDLTDAPGVGDEHSYFKLKPSDPENLKHMFLDIFQGGCAEKLMAYDDSLNVYRLR